MARPRKNNAEYFPHDANMRDDLRIKAIRRKFSHTGYAVWNYLLETLTNSDFFEIVWDDVTIELLAADYGVAVELLNEMVDYFVKIELLRLDDNKLYSPSHCQRLTPLIDERNRRRNPDQDITGVLPLQNSGNTGVIPEFCQNSSGVSSFFKSKGKEREEKKLSDESKESADKPRKRRRPSPASPTPDEFEEIVRFYNDTCKSLRPVKILTDKRRAAVSARLREHGREAVFNVIRAAGRSSFLAGQNTRGWTADFDWIFRPENFVKVSEGKYENMEKSQQHGNESDQPSVTSVRIPL